MRQATICVRVLKQEDGHIDRRPFPEAVLTWTEHLKGMVHREQQAGAKQGEQAGA